MDQIKLNVGGYKYEESPSVFQAYPDSKLWQKILDHQAKFSPDTEIFIRGNGTMFHFVMDYLRNDRVFLPVTISRETFMNELTHYGIQIREDDILVTSEDTQGAYKRTGSMTEDDTKVLPMTSAV